MSLSVVSNGMSRIGHHASNLWMLFCVTTDHEKGRVNVVLREYFEELGRVMLAWTIIESKRQIS